MDEHAPFMKERTTIFCTHCGKENNIANKFCDRCGKSLSQDVPPKPTRNKKFKIFGSVILAAVLITVLFFVVGSGLCRHEWIEATCEHPQYCSKCEKTKGTPVDHVWNDATCTVAQSCKICSAVKGLPLGHTPGDEVRLFDSASGEYMLQQICSQCSQQISSRHLELDSFVENGKFIFSAQDFLDRMEALAKDVYPDFHYEFVTERDTFMVHLFLTKEPSVDGTFVFFSDDNVAITADQMEEPGIWCFSVADTGTSDKYGGVLSGEMIELLYRTCDPLLTEKDLTLFVATKLTSALNTAEGASLFGYMEKNGLLYEFGHILVADIAAENIQVYAADWRQ